MSELCAACVRVAFYYRAARVQTPSVKLQSLEVLKYEKKELDSKVLSTNVELCMFQ